MKSIIAKLKISGKYLNLISSFQRLLLPPWWEELQHLGFLETSPSSTLRPTSSAFEHYESEDDDLKKEDISFANNANLQATGNPYRSISLTPGALLAQKRSETSQSRTSNSSLEASASTIGMYTLCVNFKNLLSHVFDKNFVKAMALENKLQDTVWKNEKFSLIRKYFVKSTHY